MSLNITAIVQARMGSSRLPGKVLLPLGKTSVLSHVIRRLQCSKFVNQVIVATSELDKDSVIENEASRHNVFCWRGSEEDVLQRFYEAASFYHAEIIVRITADCPFLDPQLIDNMVRLFIEKREGEDTVDYLSNSLVRTWPRGLDAEIFTMLSLQDAHNNAKALCQREHVTPYIYENPHIFSLLNYKGHVDLSSHRWTLDTPEDYKFLSTVEEGVSARYPGKQFITTDDILCFLNDHPEVMRINNHIKQKNYTQR